MCARFAFDKLTNNINLPIEDASVLPENQFANGVYIVMYKLIYCLVAAFLFYFF